MKFRAAFSVDSDAMEAVAVEMVMLAPESRMEPSELAVLEVEAGVRVKRSKRSSSQSRWSRWRLTSAMKALRSAASLSNMFLLRTCP